MNAISSALHRSWWVWLVYGVVSVLFGLFAVVQPAQAGVAFAWALGVMALAEGIITVAALFDSSSPIPRVWLIVYAIASIGFGVLAVTQPAAAAASMMIVLAAWLLIAGVFRIVFALRLRKVIDNEWLMLLSGVLAIALGLLIAAYPIAGLIAAMVWIGVGALFYGVLQIVVGFNLRRRLRA